MDLATYSLDVNRTLPSSDEAEKGCVCSFMIDCSKCLEAVGDKLRAEHFHHPAYRRVWEAIVGLHNAGKPYDLISLTAEFQKGRELESVGGSASLMELNTVIPTWANIAYFTEVMVECYHRREMLRAITEVAHSIYEDPESLADSTKGIEDSIASWREGTVLTDDPTDQGVWMDLISDLESRDELRREGKLRGIPTGIPWFDQITQGLMKEVFYLIGGRPSDGKSALLSQMAVNAAKDGRKTLIISMEMGGKGWRERQIAQWGAMTSSNLKEGLYTQREITLMPQAVSCLRDHVFVVAKGRLTVAEIESYIRRALTKFPDIAWVGIDYLQIIKGGPSGKNTTEDRRIAENVQAVNDMKIKFNIPIVAAAELNRGPEDRKDKRPRLGDIRSCGSIEYIIDCGLLLHAEEQTGGFHRKVKLIMAKSRDGLTDERDFIFNKKWLKFEEPEE